MNSKMPKLNKEDAAAVDLLLDRSPAASGKAGATGAVYASTHGANSERVRSVEKILSLLQWMPAGDPPRNLLKNTLRHIDQADIGQTRGAGVPLAVPALMASSAQPHA